MKNYCQKMLFFFLLVLFISPSGKSQRREVLLDEYDQALVLSFEDIGGEYIPTDLNSRFSKLTEGERSFNLKIKVIEVIKSEQGILEDLVASDINIQYSVMMKGHKVQLLNKLDYLKLAKDLKRGDLFLFVKKKGTASRLFCLMGNCGYIGKIPDILEYYDEYKSDKSVLSKLKYLILSNLSLENRCLVNDTLGGGGRVDCKLRELASKLKLTNAPYGYYGLKFETFKSSFESSSEANAFRKKILGNLSKQYECQKTQPSLEKTKKRIHLVEGLHSFVILENYNEVTKKYDLNFWIYSKKYPAFFTGAFLNHAFANEDVSFLKCTYEI